MLINSKITNSIYVFSRGPIFFFLDFLFTKIGTKESRTIRRAHPRIVKKIKTKIVSNLMPWQIFLTISYVIISENQNYGHNHN